MVEDNTMPRFIGGRKEHDPLWTGRLVGSFEHAQVPGPNPCEPVPLPVFEHLLGPMTMPGQYRRNPLLTCMAREGPSPRRAIPDNQ